MRYTGVWQMVVIAGTEKRLGQVGEQGQLGIEVGR